MAQKCDLCEKKKTLGVSGAHQYGGNWAMRAPKKTKIWKPNLQSYTLNGKKMKLCTRCIKRVKFELRKLEEKKAVKAEKPVEVKTEVKEKVTKKIRVPKKTSK